MIAPDHGSIAIPSSVAEESEIDDADDDNDSSAAVSRIYGTLGEEPRKDLPLFRFLPGGTGNGSRIHALFEKIPLSAIAAENPSPEAITEIRSIMNGVAAVRESAEDGEALQAILKMMKDVGELKLPSLSDKGVEIRLREVDAGKQMHEWKFDFSSARAEADTKALYDVIRKHWQADPSKRVFIDALEQCSSFKRIPNGWMTGSVDLLFENGERFYVVDWKTNILGQFRSEFSPQGLTREMARNFYFLQYLVYSAAVHRYLSESLPGYDYDRNFGGVYYVFVRAFAFDDAQVSDAVFADRPSRELLEEIGKTLGLKGE